MRYKVYCDDYLIMDSMQNELQLINPVVELELNKLGSFSFTIYPSHPLYNKLQKLKSIIRVYQDDYLLFRGRILNDEEGFYNEKQVLCEGELAFLVDTIQRPYDFLTGEKSTTIADLFRFYINRHNKYARTEEHYFNVGEITVEDENNYIVVADSTYMTTWDSINKKLIEKYGGYLRVRHEEDGNYIDYLKDFDTLGSQPIEFGKNLLDISKSLKGEDIYTAIIPIGAVINEETEERLTIEELENDTDSTEIRKYDDYIYDLDSVEKYGFIFKTQTWDDVTVAENLLTKAKAQLIEDVKFQGSIELQAADLSSTKNDISSFKIGNYVIIKTRPHSINDKFLIQKISIALLSPSQNKITIGTTYRTFTEQSISINNKTNATIGNTVSNVKNNVKQIENNLAGVQGEVEKVEGNVTNLQGDVTNLQGDVTDVANGITEQISSEIQQNSEMILTKVSEEYFSQSDAEELVSSVNTQFSQTNEEFLFRFEEFEKSYEDVQNGNEAKFSEITKYIRFIDGNIVLGESGNQITLKIQNDRISFLENDVEVAYFQNRKLYVNDGEFISSLRIGGFEFVKRSNGHLSFRKAVN